MKCLFSTLLFLLTTLYGFTQEYPFAKHFVDGTVIMNDASIKTGQVKWYPSQNERLQFRESGSNKTEKYSPEEILGFTINALQFVSLHNFEVVAEDYPLQGKLSKIKHSFGKVIDKGSFNIYFIVTNGYNGFTGNQFYINFLFEKGDSTSKQYTAYPWAIRMKDKRYEQAKENLYVFFKDYPQLIEKIKAFKQEDNFYEIIDLMKTLN